MPPMKQPTSTTRVELTHIVTVDRISSGWERRQVASETKQDVVNDITDRLGAAKVLNSTGSTELKRVFELVVDRFELPISKELSKPALAEKIAAHAGVSWDDECDSRRSQSGGGGTVTIDGLRRVRDAVNQFLAWERQRTSR